MRRLLALVVVATVALPLGGCVLVSRPHAHGHSRASSPRPHCRPSHYWDGHQCRHKGKGHGARKHDHR